MLQKSTASFESWAGFAFEGICFKHVAQIKKALGISHVRTEVTSWRKRGTTTSKLGKTKTTRCLSGAMGEENVLENPTRGAQIDLLFDRDDGIVTLCEIKYSKDAYAITKDYVSILEHKMQLYKNTTQTKKSLFLAMITVNGLADNPHARRLVTNTITVRDLFSSV